MVLVSILMGSYNHEKYIGEAIESVLNQTFRDFEFIIIDDCSTDNSPKIIESYKAKDPRIRAYFNNQNLGISRVLNKGLEAARGEFISFLDSDDAWIPEKLEKQISLIKKHKNKIIWSEAEVIDRAGTATGQTFTEMHCASNRRKTGNLFKELIDDNFIACQSLLFKKHIMKGILFDPNLKYLNDHRFLIDLANEREFYFIPEKLVKYRVHGLNTYFKDEKSWLKDRIILRKYILRRYGTSISNNSKGLLNLKIGIAYFSLGEKELAKQFFLNAISVDFLSKNLMLYLLYGLTGAKGSVGSSLLSLYYKFTSKLPSSY